MGELETNEELNIEVSLDDNSPNNTATTIENHSENTSTDMIEYKEVDEPCVALTIIGENRLSEAEVFVRRGIRYSIKAFFSTLVLTIMNMFI